MLREYLPFWARLTEGQQRRLEEGAAVRRFARGEMVYGGGTECAGLILPTEGQLRAYMLTDEGRELTLYRLFPRDMCLFSASCMMRMSFGVGSKEWLSMPAGITRDSSTWSPATWRTKS